MDPYPASIVTIAQEKASADQPLSPPELSLVAGVDDSCGAVS